MDLIFGIWNVRNLYRAGSLITVATLIAKYKLDLAGIPEVRWDREGTKPPDENIFLYGKGNENQELVARCFLYI
jgi:hypothetical protein